VIAFPQHPPNRLPDARLEAAVGLVEDELQEAVGGEDKTAETYNNQEQKETQAPRDPRIAVDIVIYWGHFYRSGATLPTVAATSPQVLADPFHWVKKTMIFNPTASLNQTSEYLLRHAVVPKERRALRESANPPIDEKKSLQK